MKQRKFLLLSVLILLSANTYATGDTADSDTSPATRSSDVRSNLQAQPAQDSSEDLLSTDTNNSNQQSYEAAPTGVDLWLMALAGAGLIVLQLRRKQKSLPQRPVTPMNNESIGGEQVQRHADVAVDIASR